MVLDLMLIGLGITLEPFPLMAFILILSTKKGTRNGLAFIPGWLASVDRISIWGAAGLAIFLQPWALVGAGAATVVAAKVSPGRGLRDAHALPSAGLLARGQEHLPARQLRTKGTGPDTTKRPEIPS